MSEEKELGIPHVKIGTTVCSGCGRQRLAITEKLKGSGINLNDYCIGTNCVGLSKKSYYTR